MVAGLIDFRKQKKFMPLIFLKNLEQIRQVLPPLKKESKVLVFSPSSAGVVLPLLMPSAFYC